MDFLNPRARKRRNVRLMIGYALMAILITTASSLLVLRAYGFDFDRKSGEVIQNGLVYIDSAPQDAQIYINGQLYRSTTNTRLTLPEGKYDIELKRDGYRDWRRVVDIKGGSVERITYPLLIQDTLTPLRLTTFGPESPVIHTQSPDRRWLLVSTQGNPLDLIEYDLRNLNNVTQQPESRLFGLPREVFGTVDPNVLKTLEVEEWSTDNRHVMVSLQVGENREFVMIDRENPASTFSVSRLVSQPITEFILRDKKFDQWYALSVNGDLLRVNRGGQTDLIASNVITVKSHDASTLLYAERLIGSDKQRVMLRSGNDARQIIDVAAGELKLDVARYDGDWVVVVASAGEKKTYIYRNPQTTVGVSGANVARPVPVAIVKDTSVISDVSFSANAQFMVVRSSQAVAVFDAEKTETYSFQLEQVLDSSARLEWMDGHRLLFRSGGSLFMTDFDGSNVQKIAPVLAEQSTFFDRDYSAVYTLQQVTDAGTQALQHVLMKTELRQEADR